MTVRKVLIFLTLAVAFVTTGALHAQDNSSMTGTVTDTTGAVVPGATVVLSNAKTGTSFTAKTNSLGSYRFANVPPQTSYVATVTGPGFSTVVINDIALQVGITRTQNITLKAGTTEQLSVSASNAEITLNTTDASIGNNFDVNLVNELPVQNRDTPVALFTLQPGVAASTPLGTSFTGARTDQSSVTVDGMDVNDVAAGGFGVVADAPVDSVQEFRGTVAGLPSDLGTGSGGQFQLVTKSGTNQFHGNLNEYHRDTSTVANQWFNNNAGVPRTPLIRNQFGGNIGGPIIIPKLYNGRDKLFFFFDFNNSRIIQSGSAERVVPIDSYRNGTINYILKNVGGTPAGATCGLSTLLTAPQCIGNASSAQVMMLDPQGIGFSPGLLTFINSRYPHVNDPGYSGADGINTGGFLFTQPRPDILYNYVGRVDYNITPKNRVFGRFTIQREDLVYALNDFPADPLTSPEQNRSYGYVVSDIWQIGGNKVNQFYYGDTISKFNFPNLYNPTGANQFSFSEIGAPFTSGSSQKRRVPIPELRDDFNWTKGSHNISFGGTFKFIKTHSNLTNDFSFYGIGLGTNLQTLNASLRPANIRGGTTAPARWDAAFTTALGHLSGISSNYNFNAAGVAQTQGLGATRAYRYYQTEGYVGDTWKMTKTFTLTYGLRYQLYTVPYEVHGDESIQNLTFNQLFNARVVAGKASQQGNTAVPFVTYNLGGKANNAAPLYQPSYKDFAPRVAFSWQAHPHTVLNGSAAVVYDRTVINAINFIQDQSSFLFQNNTGVNYGSANANAALLNDPRVSGTTSTITTTTPPPIAPAITKPYTPYVTGTTPYGGTSGTGYSEIVDPTLKDPYSLVYNAGLQQEFGGGLILKLNYVGRFGRRLIAQADAAQVVDFVDPVSKQPFSQAFANVTQQLRAGATVTNQPWFENVVGTGATPFLVANFGTLMQLGDIADFANALEENGLTGNNVNVGAQFALNPWVTNKGFSSYNGFLVTLSKNLSRGVQFDVNYTWSHSMDNVSAQANYIAANTLVNFICDATQPRACRGNSDFDIQEVLNSDFIVKLPIGRGKALLGNTNRFVDELIGGWSVSGTPQWRSGIALGLVSNAFVAGFNEDAPPIFNGNRGAVKAQVHKLTGTNVVQMFASQTNADAAFTGPIGLTVGSRNNLRGPSAFNMDAGLAKRFPIVSEVDLKFRADFFNVLNHPTFGLPNNDITSGSFGQISGTSNTARVGQFSLRLEF
jgi:hypothetical protein